MMRRSKLLSSVLYIMQGLALSALLIGLASCNQAEHSANNGAATQLITGTPSSAAVATPPADATATQLAFMSWAVGMPPDAISNIESSDPTKYAELDAMARTHAPEATLLALTPTQPNPGPPNFPTDTPGSSPTPVISMGMLVTCQASGHWRFLLNSCWRGVVNGQTISVGTGIKVGGQIGGKDVPNDSDYTDGWVLVFSGPYLMASDPNPASYEAPSDVGIVAFESVNANLITLFPVTFYSKPRDGTSVIFDLATRQFETASGTPIPTTPVPTVAP